MRSKFCLILPGFRANDTLYFDAKLKLTLGQLASYGEITITI